MRLLIVEDNKTLAEWLAKLLRGSHYVVDCVHDGETAVGGTDLTAYDLLIVDLALPEMSGIDVVRHMRASGLSTPILILTAKEALESRVEGLDAGADDYLTKPFEVKELDARLRALLRRSNTTLKQVSQETVNDFQLSPGDTINLRLQSAADHQCHVVHFRFVGVACEFPTAPKDSFLIANARYVSSVTGNLSREIVLLKTAGDPSAVHEGAAEVVKNLPGAKVTDINQAAHLIGSSLTAVGLGGLTKLELGYAVILSGCAAGLVLALGVLDRRRSFAIMTALGAKPHQLLAFLRGEAALILVAGTISGAITGTVVAWMLVKLLTGVFDPPPESLNAPWLYIGAVLVTTVASVMLALVIAGRRVERSPIAVLRETA